MSLSRALVLVGVVAALHGLFFIWYQRPDWYTRWTDQEGYRRLGAVLAATGQFTRYPDAPRFVPEVIRTPGYPAFLAAVYRIAGIHQLPVAVAQTAVFILICGLAFLIASEVWPPPVAVAAAAVTALYSPLPYFGALVMTEMWTTFLLTLSLWLCLRARRTARTADAAMAGVTLAATALTRPVFVLLPFALLGTAGMLFRRDRAIVRWAVGAALAALTLVPWFAYNYVYLHRISLSPAGGLGRAVWEGTWQARWSGRLHNELTHTAERLADSAALDEAVRRIAAEAQVDSQPMLTYVHQWQDIRRIWTEPVDPYDRAMARIAAEAEYMRVGIGNIRRNPLSHFGRRLTRGLFVLWAGEIPIRYSDINDMPMVVVRILWIMQAGLVALAALGLTVLYRGPLWREAILLVTPVAYVTAVHVGLLTEARQSLPAMPALLVLATGGAAHLLATIRPPTEPAARIGPA